jgi:hypothetical protein
VLHRTEENYGSAASDVHKLVINCCCILCHIHYSIRIILEGMHCEIRIILLFASFVGAEMSHASFFYFFVWMHIF